jgi:hypothetical protein
LTGELSGGIKGKPIQQKMNRENWLKIQIFSLAILVLLSVILHAKDISLCISTSAIFRNTQDVFEIHYTPLYARTTGIDVVNSLQFSWHDIIGGFYPYAKIAFSLPFNTDDPAIDYQTTLLYAGVAKYFRIENSNVDVFFSLGNRWQFYWINDSPEKTVLSLDAPIISPGIRLRSPLYKKIFTSICYEYINSKNLHVSGNLNLGPPYDLKLYGNLHIWSIGLGMEF